MGHQAGVRATVVLRQLDGEYVLVSDGLVVRTIILASLGLALRGSWGCDAAPYICAHVGIPRAR